MGVRARLRRQVVKVSRVGRKLLELFHTSTLPPPLAEVAGRVRRQGLTYLSPAKLDKLGNAVLEVERRAIPGAILEAGCALGGSAILIAAARAQSRPLRVYDVFGMIPPPGERDDADVHDRYKVIASGKSRGLKGNRYYGYETDLSRRVKGNFESAGFDLDRDHIEMIVGKVEDTLVVVGSEMGRTPAWNATFGRDHWPFTSMMLVGPGLRGGRVVGGYTARYGGIGADPATGEPDPARPGIAAADIGATLLALGDVDPGEALPFATPLSGILA
jgi:asparagine synthase (glutamine-hydrolysing)